MYADRPYQKNTLLYANWFVIARYVCIYILTVQEIIKPKKERFVRLPGYFVVEIITPPLYVVVCNNIGYYLMSVTRVVLPKQITPSLRLAVIHVLFKLSLSLVCLSLWLID